MKKKNNEKEVLNKMSIKMQYKSVGPHSMNKIK